MQSSDLALKLVKEKYQGGNQKRLNHILGVAKMASYLAKLYGVDINKALTAAYMHDYCKYDDFSDADKVLTKEEYAECKEYPFLFHAYLSAYKYKELIGSDLDIFNAIYNHVFGRCGMSLLEAIIMVSDFTEENREYDSCIECRKLLLETKDLNLGVYKSLELTIAHLKKENLSIHPRQLEVFNEYKRKVNL